MEGTVSSFALISSSKSLDLSPRSVRKSNLGGWVEGLKDLKVPKYF